MENHNKYSQIKKSNFYITIVKRRIVIGDIHGCFNTLKTLIERKIILSSEDHLYFVGDFIDRGPKTRDVIEYLIQLKRQGYYLFPVRGNHEAMLLNALQDESNMRLWYANGAEETIRSFEIPEHLLNKYECLKFIPDHFIQFINSFPYYYSLEDYIIVHAGINFSADDIFIDHHAMLWTRNMTYQGEKISYKTIVHGHTPTPLTKLKFDIINPENKILNIDTGCVYKDLPGYGILVGLNLDNRELYFQEYID